MQKAIVFCFCLAETFFPASLSFAQNVQFRVTTDNTPMAYTYVFINQKAVGSTDTLGLFSISADSLQRGDTVSFRYIGTSGQSVVYDGSDRYDVTLMPAMLDEVTVTMRQPQKDLCKIARFVPCVNWYEELTGTLSISEITEIPAAKVYDGRLTLIYIPSTDRRPQMVGIGRFSPTFTSAPGEKSTFKAIQESIYAAFVHPRAYMNKKVRIYYDGESSDRQKTYSIVRPYLRGADNRQIRLYIDPATQFVRRASVFILNPNGSSLEIDANYALSTSRQQYYPEQVHAVITDSTQRTYEVTVSGMTLNTGNVKKYRKFQNDMLKTRQLPSIE